uniref:Uncharacterized protein n=1 Tax=Cacopsylla melanoneura TaxID=428564 RepID=A0A8D8Z7I0_9HEMI
MYGHSVLSTKADSSDNSHHLGRHKYKTSLWGGREEEDTTYCLEFRPVQSEDTYLVYSYKFSSERSVDSTAGNLFERLWCKMSRKFIQNSLYRSLECATGHFMRVLGAKNVGNQYNTNP